MRILLLLTRGRSSQLASIVVELRIVDEIFMLSIDIDRARRRLLRSGCCRTLTGSRCRHGHKWKCRCCCRPVPVITRDAKGERSHTHTVCTCTGTCLQQRSESRKPPNSFTHSIDSLEWDLEIKTISGLVELNFRNLELLNFVCFELAKWILNVNDYLSVYQKCWLFELYVKWNHIHMRITYTMFKIRMTCPWLIKPHLSVDKHGKLLC